jgi:hypothetical protein
MCDVVDIAQMVHPPWSEDQGFVKSGSFCVTIFEEWRFGVSS